MKSTIVKSRGMFLCILILHLDFFKALTSVASHNKINIHNYVK